MIPDTLAKYLAIAFNFSDPLMLYFCEKEIKKDKNHDIFKCIRDHPFRTYVIFSEKLTFLTRADTHT